jgi:hypothetical protein
VFFLRSLRKGVCMCRMHTVDLLERKCSSTPHTEKAFLMQIGGLEGPICMDARNFVYPCNYYLDVICNCKKNLCHNLGSLKVK